ncbi:ribonuclease H-like domain-containing protein [Tanacetum coccineum]
MKKFPKITQRIEEDYRSIKDDISLVSVYIIGDARVQGMLIPDAFLTMKIRATTDFKEYEMVFKTVDVPMNQLKKRKQSAEESSLPQTSLKITIGQQKVDEGNKDDDDSENREDEIHSYHDDHQEDDAPPEGEKRVKRHKASKSSKSARGSSSKHSTKDSMTYVSKQQQQQQEWDAQVEDTIIDEDEVIPEEETPEQIIELQDVDKRVPIIFDYERIRDTLNDALSNQFKNTEEITEVVRITTDQPHGLDFMEQIIVMRENDRPNSFSEANFKYLNKNDIEDLYYLCQNKKLGIKSYQIKINLIALTLTFPGIEAHEPYSIVDKPFTGLIYLNNKDEKRVMYLTEIVKFCDATLEKVLKEKSNQSFKGKNISNNNSVGTGSSSGYTDEKMATLISLIKDNKNGKNVHANMAVGHPNRTKAFISKIGNLKLSNGLTLYDVFVIPEYCVTLISVHKLAKENKVVVAFDENKCYFFKSGFESEKCFRDWLGHPADPVLNGFKNSLQIDNIDKHLYCEVCQRAKQTREPFALSDHVSSSLGELFKKKIKVFKSDNGTEFVNQSVNRFCADKGLPLLAKFGGRYEKCVMIGYFSVKKGYRLYSLDKHQFIFSRDVKFFENNFPFKDSDKVKNDTANVFQDVNHINFFDLEYSEIPNDDERVDPKLNSDNKSQSASSSSSESGRTSFTADFLVNSMNDADSSDNCFLPLRMRGLPHLKKIYFSEGNLDQNPNSSP